MQHVEWQTHSHYVFNEQPRNLSEPELDLSHNFSLT